MEKNFSCPESCVCRLPVDEGRNVPQNILQQQQQQQNRSGGGWENFLFQTIQKKSGGTRPDNSVSPAPQKLFTSLLLPGIPSLRLHLISLSCSLLVDRIQETAIKK